MVADRGPVPGRAVQPAAYPRLRGRRRRTTTDRADLAEVADLVVGSVADLRVDLSGGQARLTGAAGTSPGGPPTA